MTQNKIDWRVVCVGLMCITILEVVALCNGIDGKVLTVVIAIIALAIGVVVPNPIRR